jgi:hypothetical protein
VNIDTTISASAVLALSISTLALVIATKNYRRKAGLYIRGTFSITSSRAGNDDYVSEVILENLKDRAVTIFAVYLKLGYHCYLEIENLENKPLVLKAFETYQMTSGPIEFYGSNDNRIDLNDLLRNRRVRKRLVLSTSDGKYMVPQRIRRWSPLIDYFRNHLTIIARPVSSTYEDTYLGGNMVYVVEFVSQDDRKEIVPIHPKDYELKLLRGFSLSKDSLVSKEALEHFLQRQMDEGKLRCKSYIVHDLQAWRKISHEFYKGETIRARPCSVFQYHFMGRFVSRYYDWKLSRKNALKKRLP